MEVLFYSEHTNMSFIFNDLKITITNVYSDTVDYTISGITRNFPEICIKTILMCPDKCYHLYFNDECHVIPNTELSCGEINMETLTIKKYPPYPQSSVSFCLYGDKEMYTIGIEHNLPKYIKEYPEITPIVYVRKDVAKSHIDKIKELGGIAIRCVYIWDWLMMFTRFYPVENPSCKLYMSRDLDSRYSDREKQAISQWLNESTKILHIIRDHKWHSIEILGGLWGFRNSSIEDIRFLAYKWCLHFIRLGRNPQKGPDQHFLKHLYSKYKDDAYVNDEFFNYDKEPHQIRHIRTHENDYLGRAYHPHESDY